MEIEQLLVLVVQFILGSGARLLDKIAFHRRGGSTIAAAMSSSNSSWTYLDDLLPRQKIAQFESGAVFLAQGKKLLPALNNANFRHKARQTDW